MHPIQNSSALAAFADDLAGATLIAADTEAAGYHRYVDRTCLLQVSTRRDTAVVDVLEVDPSPLGGYFEDPEVEIIFHDADYDLRLLDRDFGIRVRGLFDTKVAAEFLGEPAIGLASLLEKYVDVRLEKKYQRADWARRPLPDDMLAYAAQDTRHLPELRDRLRTRLEEAGRLAWAEEEFRLIEQTRWEQPEPDPDAYMGVKKTRDLGPRQLAALRELYAWREQEAEARDRATFRVLSNTALAGLARRMPETAQELPDVPGVSEGVARRYGTELLAAIRRAADLPERDLPSRPERPPRPPRDLELEARVDRLKSVRDKAAERLGLDRGFLMARWQLTEIAKAEPGSTEELAAMPNVRRWQVEALGGGLIAALNG